MNAENRMSATEYKRRMSGMRSKFSGQRFEDRLEAAFRWYEQNGIMRVRKTPEPMKPISPKQRDGRFLAIYTKPAQVDFSGTILGGMSIRFEAKETATARFERSRLSPEQMDDLEAHEQLGALCFVLLAFGDDDFYRVPWRVWRDMKEIYGKVSVRKEDIAEYRIRSDRGMIEILDGITISDDDDRVRISVNRCD